uniref:Protein kinase domain-containing protein n=1 Tax=viral metagenome TaxID=1070528 RepID=A0A6C0LFG6_9ZZZZ
MKYMDALRKYNEGSDKWCIPRKGSVDYLKIRSMMKKISSIQKSKSSSKEDLVEKNKRIRVLQAAIKRRLIAKPAKERFTPMSLSNKPLNSSESHAFSSDFYKNQKATKIQKFLRDKLIANKNNINNRVNTYKLVSKRIASLNSNDCLEKKVFNGVNGYTIRNVINLEKQIGTPSKYGAIYLTSIPDFLGIYPIASKVMKADADNAKEVKLMTKITDEILLKKRSRHFLMIYGSCVCTKQIADRLKLVSVNELADGDLKTLIFKRNVVSDSDLTFNILIQTFISIATFHNVLGHIHRDPHYGNFLYQDNNDKGYYHYIFNGTSYYLKACKYNIIIYDYGFASPIVEYKKTVLPGIVNSQVRMISYDYTNIIHSFFNSKLHSIENYPNIHPEPTHKSALSIHNTLQNLVTEEFAKNNAKNGEKHFENHIFECIIQEFLKYAPMGMFITKRPPNVINTTPFYISTNAANTKAKPNAKPKAMVHTPVPLVSSTEANIVAAAKKRLAEYKKFVKEMRPKVKSNFPNLNPKKTLAKIEDLYRTFIRRRDGLSSFDSVSIPK